MKDKKTLVAAAIIGCISAVLIYLLGSVIINPIINLMIMSGMNMRIFNTVLYVVNLVKNAACMAVAIFIYCKFVGKIKANTSKAILSGLIVGVAIMLFSLLRLNVAILNLLVNFLISAVVALLYFKLSNTVPAGATQTAQTESSNFSASAASAATAPSVSYVRPDNTDGLSDALLAAIRPSLKSPMSAVLCSTDEMKFTENNGEYTIEGYVNSQNSYGAMIATDFTAKAVYTGSSWIITKATVGVKNTTSYAKNFAVNYIAISIFVAVMGLLGYFILTMIIG